MSYTRKGFTGHERATAVTSNAVIYHGTTVVQQNMDGSFTLDTGGWSTYTTKRRMNQAAAHFGRGWRVFQKDFAWFLDFFAEDDNREPIPFDRSVTFFSPPVRWNGDAWVAA